MLFIGVLGAFGSIVAFRYVGATFSWIKVIEEILWKRFDLSLRLMTIGF